MPALLSNVVVTFVGQNFIIYVSFLGVLRALKKSYQTRKKLRLKSKLFLASNTPSEIILNSPIGSLGFSIEDRLIFQVKFLAGMAEKMLTVMLEKKAST